jgi:hypothetical protein
MRIVQRLLILAVICFNGFISYAAQVTISSLWQAQIFFDQEFPRYDQIQWFKGRSLYPNEFNLLENTHVWKNAQDIQSKAYISVGTERSFMGASLSKAGYLVGVDFDPEIVKFNRINAALLGLSQSRMDYVLLRFSRDFAGLKRRLERSPVPFEISEADWKWWSQLHKDGKWRQLILDSVEKSGPIGQFQKLAYWNHDESWKHLRNLVLNQRVAFFQVDLNDTKKLNWLNGILSQLNIKPGVFDSSNVLAYIGSKSMAYALQNLGQLIAPQETLIWIHTTLSLESRLFPHSGHHNLEYIWKFEKLSFSHLELNSLAQLEKVIGLRMIANSKTPPFCRRTHLDPLE